MLTIFKVSGGVFNNEEMRDAIEGQGVAYGFILTYMIIFFVLVMNLAHINIYLSISISQVCSFKASGCSFVNSALQFVFMKFPFVCCQYC